MSKFISGESRDQSTLFPESLEDYVSEDNTVRVIDVFIEELNLAELGFKGLTLKSTGRPKYHPATLLKLYLYGYLNRIQSSRRLETECQRNIELMWLLGKLAPDFKTIADFRKDNGGGIKNVCKTFVEVCRRLNMFEKPVVAIDGSKFKASNNKGNNFTPSKVKFHIDRVEKNIERYLELLDEADKEQANVTKIKATKERLADFRSQLKKLHEIKEQVEAHPDKQISTTDPDSRLMKTQGFTRVVSYNVQSAVDTKHHLIVAHDVTNVPDRGQLASMTKLAQEALRKKDIRVLADKGYFSQPDIKDTIDLGAEPIMPKTDTSSSEKKGIFNRSLFKYDANKDIYLCPAGNELQNRMQVFEQGKYLDVYFNHIACRDCKIRSQCTNSKKDPRRIRRWVHEILTEEMLQKLKNQPELMLHRKQTVEHPFGTIKLWMGATHLLTRGLKSVGTEISLHVLAYNFRRMITIMGVNGLSKAIRVALP